MSGSYETLGSCHPPPRHASDHSDLDDEYDDDHDNIKTNSVDLRKRDQETLETEEEAERLLATKERAGLGQLFVHNATDHNRKSINEKRADRRHRKRDSGRRKNGVESELMYEMEEARRGASAESSGHSSDIDIQKLGATHASSKSRRSFFARFTAIHIVIVAAFFGLLYGAYRASHVHRKPSDSLERLWNGTSTFLPTTILISLDGFRADFLQRNLTPTLNQFIRSGVSPCYMKPSFPSLTFPNHFTLVTGLYPESHGIVGNTFWDPEAEKEFFYTDPERSMQPEWWLGEPLWETAELQGVRSAVHMWPGSEAHIGSVEPYYVDKYSGDEALDKKVDRILGLLDLPGSEDVGARADQPRPQLIAAYVPNVDADGHLYGPNSTEIRSTIMQVDGMLGSLLRGIDERNLTSLLNIVVVSDHGMATTSTSRLVQLEDLIDTSLIEHTDGWPLYGLRPKDTSDEALENVYQTLLSRSRLPKYRGAFEVYLRDLNMPDRYHFSNSKRIAPVWIVPQTGWAIVTKDEFDVAEGLLNDETYHPRGLHGYDHENPLMRAIFIARGPAFPHTPGSRVEEFQNTEVYNIVCDSLGLEPRPNNGTLRLPLRPVGLHDEMPAEDVPDDLSVHNEENTSSLPEVENLNQHWASIAPTPPKNAGSMPPTTTWVPATMEDGSLPQPPTGVTNLGIPPEDTTQPTRPVIHDGITQDEADAGKNVNHWWDWLSGNLDGIKDWAAGVFSHDNGNGTITAVSGSSPTGGV